MLSAIQHRRRKRTPQRETEVSLLGDRLGISFELQTRLLIMQRRKWVPDGTMEKVLADIELEQKKIAAFMSKFGS